MDNYSVIPSLESLLSESACRRFAFGLVCPGGPRCPRCSTILDPRRHERFYGNQVSFCSHCLRKFVPLGGTVFSSCKISFRVIVLMLYLFDLGYRNARIIEMTDLSKDSVQKWRRKWLSLKQTEMVDCG
jgi:transposase-like protein